MRSNVVWKCSGIMIKGDNHTVLHNLAFDPQDNECALCVLWYDHQIPVPINNNTVVMYNAADVANGGTHEGQVYPLAGRVVKYNVISNVSKQLVDPDNFDFRPLHNLTYLQYNAGPYIYDPELTHYWIPGRQLYKTSTPVPPDNSMNIKPERRDTLMWLNAYGASVHRVYFGTSREGVSRATPDSPEYQGLVENESNVFHLKISLDPNKEYYWRVDAEVSPSEVYRGDVWSFITCDSDLSLLSKAIAWNSRLSFNFHVTLIILLYLIMHKSMLF